MGLLKFLTDTGSQAASMARIRRAHHVFGVKHLPKPRDESGVKVKQEITSSITPPAKPREFIH